VSNCSRAMPSIALSAPMRLLVRSASGIGAKSIDPRSKRSLQIRHSIGFFSLWRRWRSRTERARREIESFTLLISLFGLRILKLRSRVSRVCQELATGLKTAGRPSDCEHIHPEGCRDPAFSDSGGVLVFIRDNRLLTFPATVEWVTRSPRRSCDNFSRPAGKIVILHRRPWRSAPVRRTLRRLPRWLPREVFSFFFIDHACRP
jgi:hypothetical protein